MSLANSANDEPETVRQQLLISLTRGGLGNSLGETYRIGTSGGLFLVQLQTTRNHNVVFFHPC